MVSILQWIRLVSCLLFQPAYNTTLEAVNTIPHKAHNRISNMQRLEVA